MRRKRSKVVHLQKILLVFFNIVFIVDVRVNVGLLGFELYC